jgi:hypothetical protein
LRKLKKIRPESFILFRRFSLRCALSLAAVALLSAVSVVDDPSTALSLLRHRRLTEIYAFPAADAPEL